MSVQVGSDDLVEDPCVYDHTDHREHRRDGRRDRGADWARDMTIDHENRRQRIHRGDDPEDNERRARHTPEALSICAQRRPDHIPHARATMHRLLR